MKRYEKFFETQKLIENIDYINVLHTGKFYIYQNDFEISTVQQKQYTTKNLIERLYNDSVKIFVIKFDIPDTMNNYFDKCLKSFNNLIKKGNFKIIDKVINKNRYYTYKISK